MTETANSLEDLKTLEPGSPASDTADALVEPKVDEFGRAYATGRSKEAPARVCVKPGSGKIIINGKPDTEYFGRPVLRMVIEQPLVAANRRTEFDVMCTVSGSGLSGQAGAIRHGIARALVNYDPSLRRTMKPHGFMTRDPRTVERKKYGRRKARRSFQFSKR